MQEECPMPDETQHPARRWVVERTFSWLVKRRSIRIRWCTKVENWLAFARFACTHILFNLALRIGSKFVFVPPDRYPLLCGLSV